jgi:TetR/AcrR family transcriptional regulator of autoinduction and epiphytic fitness
LIELSPKHDHILCAAISEFAEKGLLGTKMESVAKRAEVSKRTLYKYYESKEVLFDEVVCLLLHRLSQFEQFSYDANVPLLVQLKEVAESAIQLNSDVDFLRLSRIVIIESMRSEKQAKRIHEKFSVCEVGLQSWFVQAAEAGALGKADPNFIASVFYGTLKKVTYWDQAIKWQAQISETEKRQLIDNVCTLIETYINTK